MFRVKYINSVYQGEWLMEYLGQFSIVHLILHVLCICIAYWALNAVRLEQFLKRFSSTSSNLYDIFSNINWNFGQ